MAGHLTIAHALTSFGMGGAERVALDLAAAQRAAGYRSLAISLDPKGVGPLEPEFRDRGVEVRLIPKRPGIDITLPPRLAYLFRREHVDVVHTHNPMPLIYAAPAGRAVRAAVVHTKHGEGHMGSRGQKILRTIAGRLPHAFVAVSDKTADQARQQQACPPDQLTVITNGIALSRFGTDPDGRRAVREELDIPADTWVVGTVGRIDWNKNQVALIRALEPVLSRAFQLVIVGDGPDMSELRTAAAASPCTRFVHLTGRRSDVGAILAALDVFALPSLSEGLPLVIPEAMACALPVVSTAVGGIPDVVLEGETGHLVPPKDYAAMRDRLTALAADPERARELGRRGRERALAVYSAQRMMEEYLALYERVLARESPDPRVNL